MSRTGIVPSMPSRSLARRPAAAPEARRRMVIRLWLPLTLLWIILAPFALVAAPALTLAPATRRLPPLRAAWAVGRMLLAVSGTLIEIDAPPALVRIHIL